MAYSKFSSDTKPGKTISSFHAISFLLFLHYSKRVYEVCCIHKYSGYTKLMDCLCISASYIGYIVAVTCFSSQVPIVHFRNIVLGCTLFLCGEYTNFYHHRILSNLRQNGSKKYVIPNAGLFQYVWCPHYASIFIVLF
ncbi:hypothetical protein BD770DRAFT_225281 [Pilaira anomala]|nr:hypothetical protein BD770DRAFT_225281 [Pilaira anomala]